jgi:hypothetical protein
LGASGAPITALENPRERAVYVHSSAVIVACLALGGIAYAQEGTPPTPKQQSDTPKVTVTGCLAKAETANTYVITDQKSSEKLSFNGPPQLDKYVNQTVTLTGTLAMQGSEKVFKPEAINPVSTTCSK